MDEIGSCQYLYLRRMYEPQDNALTIVVDEAAAGPEGDIEILPGEVLSGSRPILAMQGLRSFELTWTSYVAYAVRDESYCVQDTTESWVGRHLCRYAKSHFLKYVEDATIASDEYPGPLRHWGVICLNHVIDVVSTSDPVVRLLNPGEDPFPAG
jgi:hypothetical protein